MKSIFSVFLLVISLISPVSFADTSASSSSISPATSEPSANVKAEIDSYLFNAARAGDLEMLKVFAESQYDFNRQDGKGYSPLILAAYNGHYDAVMFLLANKADPCLKDKRGNTALLGAIFKGEVRIARELMKAPCTTNDRNNAGQTPAMYAALFQRHEILEALKENGADLDAEDNAGNTVNSLLEFSGDIPTAEPAADE